ncbi:MAG: NADH-quinone oxidoreductase subunit NuoK [Pseudomonadota bacterium]
MSLSISHFVFISTLVFLIGLVGFLFARKSLVVLLMCIELLLLACTTNFVVFAKKYADIDGHLAVFFILTVAAAESAIGLALILLFFRKTQSANISAAVSLKESV